MKKLLLNGLAALAMTSTVVAMAPAAQAVFTTASVSDAGILRSGQDH